MTRRTTTQALTAARDAALVDLEHIRSVLIGWETQQREAGAELDELQTRAGGAVLDDPAAAVEIPRQMQAVRDRIIVAERAAEAARGRVAAAESAFLTAEAEVVEAEAQRAAAVLARHQARTAELLEQLRAHEGEFVPARAALRSTGLQGELEATQRRVRILRDLAAGVDPAIWLAAETPADQLVMSGPLDGPEVYPACVWGPDAVVPAPAYLRAPQQQTAESEDRDMVEELVGGAA